jgi:lipopolysaccharide biosynthesis glycosyltransferase
MIHVYIGFDERETAAFHVLSHSIHMHASQPVCITPIMLSQLKGVFTRERNPLQSTDFSFSRFLAPYLANYQGWGIFMDCDMVVQDDIAKLWALRDEQYSVMCVKHDHKPKEDVKFLDAVQTKYQKKNWSSVMLFNNARCRALTPDFVNIATGLELHQFKWLNSDDEIGEIPQTWNHLVGYNPPNPNASLIHFTEGGPYFEEYADCEHAALWNGMRQDMLRVDQRNKKQVA